MSSIGMQLAVDVTGEVLAKTKFHALRFQRKESMQHNFEIQIAQHIPNIFPNMFQCACCAFMLFPFLSFGVVLCCWLSVRCK